MRLEIRVNASKPGTLRYLARRAGQPPPPSVAVLLDAVAANNLGASNFTGSVAIAPGTLAGAATACVVEGDAFELHVVAQDGEGAHAGRWPNNSTMRTVPITLAAPARGASCEPAAFLAPLRPMLSFDVAGPGLLLGAVNSSVDAATGAATWSQAVGAFGRQSAQLPARVLAAAGAVPLGEVAQLAVTP